MTAEDRLAKLQIQLAKMHAEFAKPYRIEVRRGRHFWQPVTYELWFQNTLMLVTTRRTLVETITLFCNAAYQMGCDNVLARLDSEGQFHT